MSVNVSKWIWTTAVMGGLSLIPAAAFGQGIDVFAEPGRAGGISADGTLFVGTIGPIYAPHGFVWTQATGFQDVGGESSGAPLFKMDAVDVSDSGSVIVGTATHGVLGSSNTGNRAYRWTEAGGFQDLGHLGNNNSTANGVSGDGNVIVGWASEISSSRVAAFRWTDATGMESLARMDDDETTATAWAASYDGSVIVGTSSHGELLQRTRAFVWNEDTGVTSPLPYLEGDEFSAAYDVSNDGTVIVGTASNGLGGQTGVLWRDGEVLKLGSYDDVDRRSIAHGVSHNGLVVVGGVTDGGVGFRWTEDGGMQTIEQWLRDSGATVVIDGTTLNARAANEDGSVIVGETFASDGKEYLFIARGSGLTDDGTDGGSGGGTGDGGGTGGGGVGLIVLNDLQKSLSGAASANTSVVGGLGLLLNGAGSRPLDRRTPAGNSIIWVGGDLGRTDRNSQDGDVALGEIGYGHNFGSFQLNGALGVTGSSEKTVLGGKTEVLSTYAKLEALHKLHSTNGGGLWALVSGTGLLGKADISRNYLTNGGVVDSSDGRTDVHGFGLRARLQWENLLPYTSPYGEFSHVSACLDGYTESGGSFPARFSTQCERSNEVRAGVDARVPVTDKVSVTGTLEAVHRLDSDGSGVSGQVIGLGNFNFDGGSRKQNWLRAGLGVETQLGEATLSLMGNVTTEGGAPQHWIASKLSLQF